MLLGSRFIPILTNIYFKNLMHYFMHVLHIKDDNNFIRLEE